MPNASEMIAMQAKQIERYDLHRLARKCETLEEFIEKLEAIIEGDK